jgi:hypothetical protein
MKRSVFSVFIGVLVAFIGLSSFAGVSPKVSEGTFKCQFVHDGRLDNPVQVKLTLVAIGGVKVPYLEIQGSGELFTGFAQTATNQKGESWVFLPSSKLFDDSEVLRNGVLIFDKLGKPAYGCQIQK